MIIVEGCDGSGKTTLVNSLAEDLGLSIGQRGTSNRDELYKCTREDTYRALAHAVEGYHKPYIWDRLGPFSDPIYTRVAIPSREMAFKHEEMRHCMEIFKALRCPIIICSVPYEVAAENQAMSHQMQGVDDNFKLIWELYQRLKDAALMEFHTEVYDYRKPHAYEHILEDTGAYLRRRKDREWH